MYTWLNWLLPWSTVEIVKCVKPDKPHVFGVSQKYISVLVGKMAEEKQALAENMVFETEFECRDYLNLYYSCPQGHPNEEFVEFELQQLSKTFSTGNYRGRRLIDIGTGPCIHTLISACQHFDEIMVTDLVEPSRREIEKWLKEENDCFNWDPIIEFVCKLEGRSVPQVKARLRQTVKQVVRCDVHTENPLEPLRVEPADCLVTSMCLEVACNNTEEYRRALNNISSLLKPGGFLVMVGDLEESFYVVLGKRFFSLPITEEDVLSIIRDLGFTIIQFNTLPLQLVKELSDCRAIFHLVAQKPNI